MGKTAEKKTKQKSYISNAYPGITWSEGFWLLLFLFILTQPFTIDFVSNVLVKYIFRHFPSEGFTPIGSILLIFIFLGCLIYLYNKLWKTSYIIKNIPFLIGNMGFLIFLIYHRCNSGLFILYPFFTDDIFGIKMVDLPIFLFFTMAAVMVANLIRKCVKNYNKENRDLHPYIQADVPIKDLESDQFNRKTVFESLLDTISSNAVNEDKSIAIALVNRWGEGKTSFLKILDKKIKEKKDTLVVSFNPWLSSQPDNLTIDFFNTLDKALSPYIYTGRLFRLYAQSLTKIDTMYNPLLYLPRQWLGHRSNQEYFDRIKKLIEKLNKRIFVLIDDMDRLHPKEIFELLRMIRNSASFPHMIFVVPFETEYVVQALEENRIYNGCEYLKKIFDVEISLPPITFNYIQDLLEKEFKEILDSISISKEDKEKLSGQFELCIGKITENNSSAQNVKRYKKIHELIKNEIRNRRDVIRFLNSLRIVLKDNHQRIYFPDLLILELVKMLDAREYRVIFEKYDSFLNENFREYIEGKKEEVPEAKLKEGANEEKNISEISELTRLLFQIPENDFNFENAFCHALNLSNYQEYRVKGISQKELMELYENGDDTELLKAEETNPILGRLEIYTQSTYFLPQMDDYIKIALFYSRDLCHGNHYRYYLIANSLSRLMISYLIKNKRDIEDFTDIIKEASRRMPNHYWIPELNKRMINYILNRNMKNITREEWHENEKQIKKLLKELQKINEDNLQSSIDGNRSFEHIESIFCTCIERYGDSSKPILTQRALEIFRDYINTHTENYLKHFIRLSQPIEYIRNHERYRHIPPNYYEQIFSKETGGFEEWLKSFENEIRSDLYVDIHRFMEIYHKKSNSNEGDSPIVILYAFANTDRFDMQLTSDEHEKVNPECLPWNYGQP